MSLLLDALRRAAASKQGPTTDQYTVPRRPDLVVDREASPASDGADGDSELTLEPEMSQETEARRREETDAAPATARREAAGTLAGTRRGGRHRRGSAVRVVVGGFALLGALAAIGAGTWWYYLASQQDSRSDLASWEPVAEPLVDDEPLSVGAAPAEDGETVAGAGGSGDEAAVRDDTAVAGADTEALETPDSGEAESPRQEGGSDSTAGTSAGAAAGGNDSARARAGEETGDETGSARAAAPDPGTEEVAAQSTSQPKEPAQPGESQRRAEPMVQATRGPSELARTLQAGYAALRAGDVNAAGHAYARALEIAPRNRDALLGAASVAQQRGNTERAAGYYRQVLQDHPQDDYARAALAGLEAVRQPRRSESELKGLLRERPGSASLHFALGNVYAAESRWSEAQQAYFEAHRAEPGNPDYAYNLAVALDHLGQRDAARTYYRKALAASGAGGAGFPVAAVRRRLEQLQ